MSETKRLICITAAAEILNISKTKAYNMVAAGQLPSIRMDRTVRIPYDDLMEWIRHSTRGGVKISG